MSGFSTRSEEAIERKVDVMLPDICSSENELIEKYDLDECVKWITDNNLEKVCLQFPDSLLCDSVEVSLWLEKQICRKLYILGDTSYGSCCVDEVAAEHINADGIIHFGHTCLSPTVRLPVFYVFPKYSLDVTKCVSIIRQHCSAVESPFVLVLVFDVGYSHHMKFIRDGLSDCDVVMAEPIKNKNHSCACSKTCCLLSGGTEHSIYKLGRGYCLDNSNESKDIVFIGPKESRLLYNFRISLSGNIYCYSGNGQLEPVDIGKTLQRCWYFIEKLRDAKTVGIIVGTLGVNGFLEAIRRVSTLIRRKGKKCYVISIGKPTVAKLANFPEIEMYVMISCPEAVLENKKDFYQPVVSIMEAEMALNEARSWSEISTSDFRDVIPGGNYYVELPESNTNLDPDVSLVSNKIRYNVDVEDITVQSGDDGTIQLRADMPLDKLSSNLSNRSWQGLDPSLGQVPVTKSVPGRSGIPQAYSDEVLHSASK
ncbi:2-(3-amino-3-carboxypropyl)histidine synthase subunit 2-like isoform X2 [Lycorma delicatula]|uniref:2-(3-amino-3-carboxypropyl)histidine synthase subunit 2-like isoform X2 n=1 Tax=Lycorma delicatula TaxID=130591 RepID=UPI003F5185B0